jgi:hypothetical protein
MKKARVGEAQEKLDKEERGKEREREREREGEREGEGEGRRGRGKEREREREGEGEGRRGRGRGKKREEGDIEQWRSCSLMASNVFIAVQTKFKPVLLIRQHDLCSSVFACILQKMVGIIMWWCCSAQVAYHVGYCIAMYLH